MRERKTSRRVRPMSVSGWVLLSVLTQCNTYTPDLLLEPIQVDEPTEMDDDDVGPLPAETDDDLPMEPEPGPSAPPEPSPAEPAPVGPDPVGPPEPSAPEGTGGSGAVPTMAPTAPEGSGGAPPTAGAPTLPGGAGGTEPTPTGGMAATGGVPPEPSPEPEPVAGAGGAVVVPSVDPNLIENFEDGNVTLLANAGRRGFWFTDGAEEGTISDFAVEAVDPQNPELPDSTRAMHVTASDFAADSWAAAGVTLNDGDVYDGAAGFAGIQFWARHGGTGSTWFSFRVPTASTDVDDDHFGVLIELSDAWTRYRVPFDDTLQQQGFGEPQTFDPAELMELQFSLAPGETGFDFWVDDVEFY